MDDVRFQRVLDAIEAMSRRLREQVPVAVSVEEGQAVEAGHDRTLIEITWSAAGEADRIADAVREATGNPGRMVSVDEAWEGFPLDGDEVQR